MSGCLRKGATAQRPRAGRAGPRGAREAARGPRRRPAGRTQSPLSPTRSPAESEKRALLGVRRPLASPWDPFLSFSLPLQLQASGDSSPGTFARLSALRGQKDRLPAVPEPEEPGKKPRGPRSGLLSQKLWGWWETCFPFLRGGGSLGSGSQHSLCVYVGAELEESPIDPPCPLGKAGSCGRGHTGVCHSWHDYEKGTRQVVLVRAAGLTLRRGVQRTPTGSQNWQAGPVGK